MNRFASGLAIAVFFLTACDQAELPTSSSDNVGRWELQAFEMGANTTPIPNPENYTLEFTDDGRVSIRADCNRCNGSYEARGNQLTIGPLGCTRAFCGPDSFFDEYVAALQSASSFARSGNELVISTSGGTMRFEVSQ
jgi:heat shock protein HslJ